MINTLNKKELAEIYKTKTVRYICEKYNLTSYMFYQLIDKLGIERKRKDFIHANDLVAQIKGN